MTDTASLQPAARRPHPLVLVGYFVIAVGAALPSLELSDKVAIVDVLLIPLVLFSMLLHRRMDPRLRRLLGRVVICFYLIAIGSFAGLIDVGLPSWTTTTLLQDAYCAGIFFAAVALASRWRGALPGLGEATALAVFLVAVSITVSRTAWRATGSFENPNYAAHYLALGVLFVLGTQVKRWQQIAVVGMAAIAIVRTASFGGLLVLLVGGLYLLSSRTWNSRSLFRKAGLIFLYALIVLSGVRAFSNFSATVSAEGGALSSRRFEHSSGVRLEIWREAISQLADHPTGVGPYGLVGRELLTEVIPGRALEVHSDFIGYLVERGIVGLIGLLSLGVALWRSAWSGSATRSLIVGIAVGGAFRETLHFRHLWLLLAVAVVSDMLSDLPRARPTSKDRADQADTVPLRPLAGVRYR